MNNYNFHSTQDSQRREDDARQLADTGHKPLSQTAYRQLKGMKKREGVSETFKYRLNLALEREYITNKQYKELK